MKKILALVAILQFQLLMPVEADPKHPSKFRRFDHIRERELFKTRRDISPFLPRTSENCQACQNLPGLKDILSSYIINLKKLSDRYEIHLENGEVVVFTKDSEGRSHPYSNPEITEATNGDYVLTVETSTHFFIYFELIEVGFFGERIIGTFGYQYVR